MSTVRASSRLSRTGSSSPAKRSIAYLWVFATSASARRRTFSISARARKNLSRFSAACAFAASSSVSSRATSVAALPSEPCSGARSSAADPAAGCASNVGSRFSDMLNPSLYSSTSKMGLGGRAFKTWRLTGGVRAERRAQKPGGEVHDRDNTFIGHTRRSDYAKRADRTMIDGIRGGHDAAIFEHGITRFRADEYLDPVDTHALIEQVQQVALRGERLEEFAQFFDVPEIGNIHQIRLAAHDQLVRVALIRRKDLARHVHRKLHHALQVGARLLHLPHQRALDVREHPTRVTFIEIIGRLFELRGRVFAIGGDDAVVHVPVFGDENHEDSPPRHAQEIDVLERDLLITMGDENDAGELADLGEQVRGGLDQLLRLLHGREFLLQQAHLLLVERSHL